jgi:hypothetical protein
MLNVIKKSVANKPFVLSVVMLSVIMLSVVMLSLDMLSLIMLSVVMLSVVMLSVVMLSVTNKPFILNFLMLSVANKPFMLNVVMLSGIILNVVAPQIIHLFQGKIIRINLVFIFVTTGLLMVTYNARIFTPDDEDREKGEFILPVSIEACQGPML